MKKTKKALLIVSFGTSYNDTRQKTLDAAVADFERAFPDYDVFNVFTSRVVKYILKKRDDYFVYNLDEVFKHLKENGYRDVLVQSMHIMNAFESRLVAQRIADERPNFDSVVFGTALFTTHDDYIKLIEAIEPTFPECDDDAAIVMMGHGTDHPAHATYMMLEHLLHARGHERVLIGTIEGYPHIEDVMVTLQKRRVKKVILMPLLIVAGDHALNDLSGDEEDSWKQILLAAGYRVEIVNNSIGELPAIRQIFVDHAKRALTSKSFMDFEGKKYRPER